MNTKMMEEPLLQDAVRPNRFDVDYSTAARSAVGGILAGILTLFRAVSFALCYAHANPLLTSSFGVFLQGLLLSTVLSQSLYGIRHSFRWAVACPSSTAVPFSAAILAKAAAGASSASAAVLRSSATMSLGSFATAAAFWGIRMSSGPKVEALKGSFPQPLILGLFGSVGISMVQSSLELVSSATLLQPCLTMLAGALMRCTTRSKRFGRYAATLPGMLVGHVVLFHLLRACTGTSINTAREQGWLFDTFEPVPLCDYFSFLAQLLYPGSWAPSDAPLAGLFEDQDMWTLLISLIPLLVLDLITVIAPYEALERQSLPVDGEFGLAAAACLFSGVVGCTPSYASLSPSKLCLEAGGGSGSYVTSAFAVLVPACGLTALGPAIVTIVPRYLVAGLLVHLGFGYMLEGLWDSRLLLTKVAPSEYFVIATVVGLSLISGLAQAIFVGLLLLSLLFVVRYAQGEVIQFACCAQQFPSLRSRQFRTAADWDVLQSQLSRVFVVRASCSHLFFGSISSIVAASPCDSSPSAPKQFLLLDFDLVRTIDTSALVALQKFPPHVIVYLVGLQHELVEQLRTADTLSGFNVFSSLDAALEKCENLLLHEVSVAQGSEAGFMAEPISPRACKPAYADTLTDAMVLPRIETKHPMPLPSEDAAAILTRCFPGISTELATALLQADNRYAAERKMYVCGEVICEEGDPCRSMLVCLSGQLTVYKGSVRLPIVTHKITGVDFNTKRSVGRHDDLENANASEGRRVGGLGPGDVLGEVALVCTELKTHCESLVADTGCEILHIHRETMLKLEMCPDLRLAFELKSVLARRLAVDHPTWAAKASPPGSEVVASQGVTRDTYEDTTPLPRCRSFSTALCGD